MTSLSSEQADHLSALLLAALSADANTGASPAKDGWELRGVRTRFLMSLNLPVAAFHRDGTTLEFIVSPTDKSKPAYKRTARLDVTYFSEDVPDDQQQGIYTLHRAMIERFATWVATWDARGEVLP